MNTYFPIEPEAYKPEIGDLGAKVYDNLILAEVMPPKDGILVPA
jgi:hypothetical protein